MQDYPSANSTQEIAISPQTRMLIESFARKEKFPRSCMGK